MALFHLTTRAAWAAAQFSGSYRAASLEAQGFLHLSTEQQWPRTQARFFGGQADLVLLVLDPVCLLAEVRFEPADGDFFPHLYGPLNLDAVREVRDLPTAKTIL
jgi:uncharacterized protein (DUF952 family)